MDGCIRTGVHHLPQPGSRPLKRKRRYDVDDEMRLYRRVCILDETKRVAEYNRKVYADTTS